MRLPISQLVARDRHPDHIAEVTETATTEFLAQCLEPVDLAFPVMPPFGSWVKAKEEDSGNVIFAVVYHVTASPIDSLHRAQALGLSLQELREQQPQIFAMLKTEFRAAIVGFQIPPMAGKSTLIYHHLPPRPPQIHQAVLYCSPSEIVEFTEKLDFLCTLLQLTAAPVEALVAATLREVYQLRKGDRAWLVQAGRMLSLLLKDDYDRLQLILSQIYL